MNNYKEIEIEICEIPVAQGSGKYLRMPTDGNTLYIRVYPFKKSDGKRKLGRPTACHWIEHKRHECIGKDCPHCKKGVELTYKVEVACVDRQNTPDRMQILEVPRSVFGMVTQSMKENGSSILGDSGVTFALSYNRQLKKYSVSPVIKDKTVLKNGNKLLSFEPESESRTPPVSPITSDEDDFQAITAKNPDQPSQAEKAVEDDEAKDTDGSDNDGELW